MYGLFFLPPPEEAKGVTKPYYWSGILISWVLGIILPVIGLFRRWRWAWWWFFIAFLIAPIKNIYQLHGDWGAAKSVWTFSSTLICVGMVVLLLYSRFRGVYRSQKSIQVSKTQVGTLGPHNPAQPSGSPAQGSKPGWAAIISSIIASATLILLALYTPIYQQSIRKSVDLDLVSVNVDTRDNHVYLGIHVWNRSELAQPLTQWTIVLTPLHQDRTPRPELCVWKGPAKGAIVPVGTDLATAIKDSGASWSVGGTYLANESGGWTFGAAGVLSGIVPANEHRAIVILLPDTARQFVDDTLTKNDVPIQSVLRSVFTHLGTLVQATVLCGPDNTIQRQGQFPPSGE